MKNPLYALTATLFLVTSCGGNPDSLSQNPPHTPTEGPYTHQIYGVESTDGLTWTQANAEPLAEHASVPTLGMVDGDTMVYYVDASNGPEELGCLSSSNNGKSFTQETCALEGTPTGRNVDFSFVPDNGELRLYPKKG